MINYLYNIGDTISDEKRNITIIDRKYVKRNTPQGGGFKKYKYKCNICGYDCGESYKDGEFQHEYWIDEQHLKKGVGCTCCQGRAVVKGINDVFTTNSKIASLLKDKEDAFRYTEHSHKKTYFECPICKKEKFTSFKNINLNGFSCDNCSDKMSMGEKIVYVLLSELKINFIKEFTKGNAEWTGNFRYDFYINPDIIIEVMGSQHKNGSFSHLGGRTKQEEIENDKAKKKLALDNGIKYYIEIDAYESNFEYIKNNIINSELSNLYSLDDINWKDIETKSSKSIIKEIADYWNNHTDASTKDLVPIFHLSRTTISKYLTIANKIGLCSYNQSDWIRRKGNYFDNDSSNFSTPIRCIDTDIYFKSVGLCSRLSKQIFGIQLNESCMRSVLNGEFSQHKNYHFEYVTKQQFNLAIETGLQCFGSPFYFT